MNVSQWIRILVVGTALISLTACHSKKAYQNDVAVSDANAAYNSMAPGAQTSGLGEESRFGEESAGMSSQQLLAKRTYYFNFDSNAVHDADKPSILANANYLISHPNASVLVEGHTDPRGSREYNIGLGERRAKAVADIMTAKGVSPAQVRIVSYGSQKLASSGHDEAAYQLDRRVVLVYLRR